MGWEDRVSDDQMKRITEAAEAVALGQLTTDEAYEVMTNSGMQPEEADAYIDLIVEGPREEA